MHPAYSVIFFTTLSGAGYGLLSWLALGLLVGTLSPGAIEGFIALGLGLVLVTTGLLASALHLGRPERALKAFAEWRTSWLSREGVLAVVTYIPATLLGLLWFALDPHDISYLLLAALLAVGAIATVWCTGMIYASLPTIRAWNHGLVTPVYIVLSLSTGGLFLIVIRGFAQTTSSAEILFVLALLLVSWGAKTTYWSSINRAQKNWTAGAATGLGHLGKVRLLEQPHSQANYVMREMGYDIARKHADKLRQISSATLFVLPIFCLLFMLAVPNAFGILAAIVALISAAVGVFMERWLFFAEAQHVVTLYYGAQTA